MSRKCIMLVDDQAIANFILRKMILTRVKDVEVHDFTQPESALDELPGLCPDLIFLDLNMPQLDGWGFLEGMRARSLGVPVVVVTSSTSEIDRSRALGFGNVREVYSKPVTAADLGRIEELLAG